LEPETSGRGEEEQELLIEGGGNPDKGLSTCEKRCWRNRYQPTVKVLTADFTKGNEELPSQPSE